ncbi:hypothetical protein [Amorphus orientalis]|uniref:Uncharacterized protein n=1 Tax=Amorphus orientalis TaxID=649198 RepID=A0AAE3VTW8_9HYPH|nr:hypothetical protein [Amorphus orientalis]MDQ0317770.1 hypothetical protein [Amorphus orientalis]
MGNFTIGDSVQVDPGTDLWMSGDRFGDVVKIGRKWVHVRMYWSGRTLRIAPDLLTLN